VTNNDDGENARGETPETEGDSEADDPFRAQQQNRTGVLDFLSPQFDPVAALSNAIEGVEAANPWMAVASATTTMLDRADQCRVLLPPTDPMYRPAATIPVIRAGTRIRPGDPLQRGGEGSGAAPAVRRRKPPECFAKVAEPFQTGPLSTLHRAFVERYRVRIVVRYVNGIRGTLTAYVTAFDKHFNMLLRDVEEVYTPRYESQLGRRRTPDGDEDDGHREGETTRARPDARTTTTTTDEATEPVETSYEECVNEVQMMSNVERELLRRRSGLFGSGCGGSADGGGDNSISGRPTQWSVRKRRMKQLLVRGDNIVCVYRASQERSAWPATSRSPSGGSMYRLPSSVIVPADPRNRIGTPGSLSYSSAVAVTAKRSNSRSSCNISLGNGGRRAARLPSSSSAAAASTAAATGSCDKSSNSDASEERTAKKRNYRSRWN